MTVSARLFALYEKSVLSYPAWSLLLVFALVGWLASHLGNLRLDASADSLLLEGDESLRYYREISARYAAEDFLVVTFQPNVDLFSKQGLADLEALQNDLAALDGVTSINSILNVPLLNSPKLSLTEISDGVTRQLSQPDVDRKLALQEFLNSPIYKDLLLSRDTKTTALQINLKRDETYYRLLAERDRFRSLAATRPLNREEQELADQAGQVFTRYADASAERNAALIQKVRAVLDLHRDRATIYLGGVPMITADLITFVQHDLVVFGSAIVLFIIGLMALIFRQLVWVVLPLLVCVLSAVFMLGLLAWLDWRMTVISSNFVALLLVISLSITIHLVVFYREIRVAEPQSSQRELVRQMVGFMWKPCAFTTLTTLVAFASFVVSGIRPLIDFGWMMTIGVTVALLLSFIVMPCGLLLLPKSEAAHNNNPIGAWLTGLAARFTERNLRLIGVVAMVLAGVSIYGMSLLKVENRFIDYFDEQTEIYRGMELIDRELGGTIPLEVIIDMSKQQPASLASDVEAVDEEDDFVDDFAETAEVAQAQVPYWFTRAGLNKLVAIHDYLDNLPETGKVTSLATAYRVIKLLLGDKIDDIQLSLFYQKMPDSFRNALVKPYLSEDGQQARITIRVLETSRDLNRNELLANINQVLQKDFALQPDQPKLTGMLVMYNNMLQSLFTSQILSMGVVFFAIMAMFVLLFRSLLLAVIAILPNLLAAGLVLGIVGLVGIPLDMMTITIAAITVGIGVDDTIHYVHRFRIEFQQDRNYVAAMYRSHDSIGRAMFYTSVIIIFGFLILALSNFYPSIYFGVLTALAMSCALTGAQVLLPQLLLVLKPFGRETVQAASLAMSG